MSVMTHGRLRAPAYQPQSLSPQQKAAIGRLVRSAGRALFIGAVAAAAVVAVIGLKVLMVMSRFPSVW